MEALKRAKGAGARAARRHCRGGDGMRLLWALTAFMLGACAYTMSAQADRATTELVGMERNQLLACAGVPNRREMSGDMEFFTYTTGEAKEDVCEATFVLRQGRVAQLSYRGDTGGPFTPLQACASIVETCLR
jgi:hypothetical protein